METLLLEYHPTAEDSEEAESEGEGSYSPDFFLARGGEIVRVCVQCGFSFVQSLGDVLLCLCPICREAEEAKAEGPASEDLPVRVLPSFISRLLEFNEA